jgi:hypothetical protein
MKVTLRDMMMLRENMTRQGSLSLVYGASGTPINKGFQ